MKFGAKSENVIKKRFDSESACSDKHLKTKIKSYKQKINTNFHDEKVSKEGSPYICLSVFLIGGFCKTGKNYYTQVFLEERK